MNVSRSIPRGSGMDVVLRRMESFGAVSPEQRARVEALGRRPETLTARTVLQNEGEPIAHPRYILAGWAFRQRLLPDGRRQIFSFLLPGDGVGVSLRVGPLAAASTLALTRLSLVDAADLLQPTALMACPELREHLDAAATYEEGLLLDHVVRLGRQTAYERVSHLLLELHERLQAVGLAQAGGYDAPLTQEVMADALGLSVVHINRTLQQLRRERTIVFEGGRVTLLEPNVLAAVADYTPARPGGAYGRRT